MSVGPRVGCVVHPGKISNFTPSLQRSKFHILHNPLFAPVFRTPSSLYTPFKNCSSDNSRSYYCTSHLMESSPMQAKGFEPNTTGDDNCENVAGNGMPNSSPPSTTSDRWPLQDISNLFSFEGGEIIIEEPRGTGAPPRQANVEASPATSRRGNATASPSASNCSSLRRGFR